MARLLTRHDPYHIHAILGLLALCHYVWRIARWHIVGIAFSSSWDVACVTIHGWLPLASLFLHVPNIRNKKDPMIWKEFRMHSILYGWRHVLACSASILNLWPTGLIARIALKWAFIASTMVAADFITQKLGSPTERTTNAMPYPSWVPQEIRTAIKDRYVAAQFAATAMCLYDRDDGFVAFIPLIGIQSAAFCMTLVRKGLLTSRGYHLIYSAALVLAGPWTLVWKGIFFGSTGRHGLAVFVAMFVMMPLRLNCPKIAKTLLWLLGVILIETVYHTWGGTPATTWGNLLTMALLVWYVAPYSILILGPESRLVRWSRKLNLLAFYTALHNVGVKSSTLSLEGIHHKHNQVGDQGKESASPDDEMAKICKDSHSQMTAIPARVRGA